MKKRYKKVIAFLIVIVFILQGCIRERGAQQNLSQDEKVLNIYTAIENDQISTYIADFQKRYPDVKVQITRDSTGVIISKLLAEKNQPVADVIWGVSASSLLVAKEMGALQAYSPLGVENILPQFKDSETVPFWVGIDAWETAFLINRRVLQQNGIQDIPQSYEDLIKPEYKGLIVMPHPVSSGTGTLTVFGILQLMRDHEGWKFLDALDKNIATYMHSGSQPAKSVATGEYGIGISFGYRCIKSAKDLGEDGIVVFPKEGSGWDVEANALVKKHGEPKEIAKKFLDWAISDTAMQEYQKNYPIISTGVQGGIPNGYAHNPLDQLIPGLNLEQFAKQRTNILEEWSRRYE